MNTTLSLCGEKGYVWGGVPIVFLNQMNICIINDISKEKNSRQHSVV